MRSADGRGDLVPEQWLFRASWSVTEVDRRLAAAVRLPITWIMTNTFPMLGCRVEQVTPDASSLLAIPAHATGSGSCCPDCGRASWAIHSRYRRKPADLPSLGRKGGISLRVRRFYCRNPGYPRRTFAKRLPELVAPHARCTCRLAAAQARVGAILGGNAGSRLLHHLATPASANTLLRLVQKLPLPAQEPPP
jgi:hypothetical protein